MVIVCIACSFDEAAGDRGTTGGSGDDDSAGRVTNSDGSPGGDGESSADNATAGGGATASDASDVQAASSVADTASVDADATAVGCQHTYWSDDPFSPSDSKPLRVMLLPGGDIVVVGQYANPKAGNQKMLGAARYDQAGVRLWKKWIPQAMPTVGLLAQTNPAADAVDANQIYLGWRASDKQGPGALVPGWRIASIDHYSGQLLWTRPQDKGRSVAVACLAAAATTILAAGDQIDGYDAKTKLELTTPVVGRFSPKGQVLGVAKLPMGGHAHWHACALDGATSSFALAGIDDNKGWVTVRTKDSWTFNKTFTPPTPDLASKPSIGGFLGIAVTEAGSYIAVGWASHPKTYTSSWLVGLDHKGMERFNVKLWQFYTDSHSPIALSSGGFVMLTELKDVLTSRVSAVQHYDRWGNRLSSTLIGSIKLIDGPAWLTHEAFTAADMVLLPSGALVIAGVRNVAKDPAGNEWNAGPVYHTDIWGHTTCEEAGKCGSLLPADCQDTDPCTRDTCMPDYGCVNLPWKDNTPCGEGKFCKSGVCMKK